MLFSQNFDAKKLQSGAYLPPHNAFLFREISATGQKYVLPQNGNVVCQSRYIWGIFIFYDRIFSRGQKYSVSQEIFSATLFVFPIYWSLHTHLLQMSGNVFPSFLNLSSGGGGGKRERVGTKKRPYELQDITFLLCVFKNSPLHFGGRTRSYTHTKTVVEPFMEKQALKLCPATYSLAGVKC